MKVKMKPETIARRAAERAQATAERTANLHARAKALAEQGGPGSFWADYYADMVAHKA